MGNAEHMGTHPIFESDFDCLTDCFCSEKMLSRLARPAVVQVQKRKFNPVFFWGTLPLLEKSSLDHHWHVLFTQSCQPLWASQPQHWMVTRLKRSSSKDSVPKSKISILNLFSTVCPFAYKNE